MNITLIDSTHPPPALYFYSTHSSLQPFPPNHQHPHLPYSILTCPPSVVAVTCDTGSSLMPPHTCLVCLHCLRFPPLLQNQKQDPAGWIHPEDVPPNLPSDWTQVKLMVIRRPKGCSEIYDSCQLIMVMPYCLFLIFVFLFKNCASTGPIRMATDLW